MTPDPFKPPTTDVRDPTPNPGGGSAIKGLTLGLLVDFGGSMLASVIGSIVYAAILGARGQTQEQIQATLSDSDGNPVWSGALLLVGLAFSILGGLVCERVARQGNYRLGALQATISALLGLAIGWSVDSPAMLGLLTFLTVGSILLGIRLGFDKRAT